MKLLRLMGVPVVEAPSEAEAQCSVMAKVGGRIRIHGGQLRRGHDSVGIGHRYRGG